MAAATATGSGGPREKICVDATDVAHDDRSHTGHGSRYKTHGKTREGTITMGTITKAAHIGFDLVLVSAFLAGVKCNTGLMPATEKIENETVRDYTNQYLRIGDRVYDWSVAYFGGSDYFDRK